MALTQSARLPGPPSWDDEVVPALRKRLEGESRILSKRISAAVSISSLEDNEASYQPRPSYTQQRTSSDRDQTTRAAKSNGATSQRTRTYSTPKLSEIPIKSRSPDFSPRTQYSEPKPTRIPKARGRAGSVTTNNNTNGYSRYPTPPPPAESPDLRRNDGQPAPAKLVSKPSQDTIHIPMKQTSGLFNEPPPFMPGPESANSHDEAPPRPSNDSEERPFQHWYRGEVSRNGGVGELKLGKRQEMLEIANYGHTLKQKQAIAAMREEDRSTPISRRRKRSESTAGIESHRESLYLDDEHVNDVGRVLDEGPLTDVDAEMSDGDYYHQQHGFNTSTSSAPDRQDRTTTPTPQRQQATRIPSPAQQIQRGASEPPTFPASSSSLSQSARQTQNPKRGATASPPAASSSAAKKPRAAVTPKPKPKPKPRRVNPVVNEKDRRSVAYYPSPEGDEEDMADAIPSWTQPVAPPTGRWDDVVLPVVARKKGLDTLYQQANGSPQPKKVDEPVAPAPGTFGWDHSKYRPPREGDIQMDEFGRPVDRIAEDDGSDGHGAFGRPLYPPTEHERQTVGPKARAPPPAAQPSGPTPLAQYGQQQPDGVVNLDLEAAKLKFGGQPPPPEEDGGAGCCKCVVM